MRFPHTAHIFSSSSVEASSSLRFSQRDSTATLQCMLLQMLHPGDAMHGLEEAGGQQ